MPKITLSPLHAFCISCPLLAGLLHFYAFRFFQPDDTFIFLVYAKNLLDGHGLTFNGDVVEGFSSLSWTLIVSFLGLRLDDILQAAKLASAVIYVGHALLLVALLKCWRNAATALDFALVVVLFIVMPPVAIWAASGMETILFSILLTASAFIYLIESCAPAARMRGIPSGLLFGLLATTRPEGIALIAIPCCYELARLLVLRTINWKTLLTTVLTFCVVAALLLIWRKTSFGELLPTTVQAKTGNFRFQLINGINYAKSFFAEYFYLVIGYIAANAYLLICSESGTRHFALMSLTIVGGYSAFIIAAGGDWMISYRLIAPLIPVAALTIALAVSACRTIPPKLLLVMPLAAFAIADSYALYPAAKRQAESDRGDIIMGQYIRSLNLPASTRIAVIDAGAIPYFSELPTIDMIGLNNTHIARLPGGFFQKFDNAYVLSQQPRIIQMHTQLRLGEYVPAPVFMGTVQLFYSDEFQKNYELDTQAPVKHLFRRRDVALADSPMDSFRDFSAVVVRKDQHGAILRIIKMGKGIWVAAPVQQLGTVHIAYRIEGKDGRVLQKDTVALTTDLRRGETFEISLPAQILTSEIRIVVDPVLVGVEQFGDRGKAVSVNLSP